MTEARGGVLLRHRERGEVGDTGTFRIEGFQVM